MARSELSMLRRALFSNVLGCASGVALAVGLALPCMGQATVESMQVVPAVIQAEAPMQVIATTLDLNRMDFGDSITLMNTSDKMIVSCRLGWIYRKANEDTAGPWAVGNPIEVRLSPSLLATVGCQGIGFSAARDVFKKNEIAKGEVVVGVVEVRFQDGTQWTYPLGQKGRFDFHEDQQFKDAYACSWRKNSKTKARKPKVRQTRTAGMCALRVVRPQPGLFASALDSLRGWVSPTSVRAQSGCHVCWFLVCNPASAHCNNSGGSSCTTSPCMGGYDQCFVACGVIPSGCPGC